MPNFIPVFKFLSAAHADGMIADGTICVPRLSSFRDARDHHGLIYDENEGKVFIRNTYSRYTGLRKNAEGLLPCVDELDEYVDLTDHYVDVSLDSDGWNAYAYCVTEHFLSESLEWAIDDGKEKCVMISDIMEFERRIITELECRGLQRPMIGHCQYTLCDDNRRIWEHDPKRDSITNQLLANQRLEAFFKPPKYAKQMESRIVWEGEGDDLPVRIIAPVPAICDLLTLITFDGITSDLLANRRCGVPITCTVNRRDGSESSVLRVTYPSEVFRPVIDQDDDENEPHLGFLGATPLVKGVDMANAPVGITIGRSGPVYIRQPLSNVKSIAFSHG